MDIKFWIANIVGAAGIVASMIIYQQKERKKLLVWKFISDVLWFTQYLLLGAYSGAGIALISMIRGIVFVNKESRWAKSKAWLYGFLLASVGIGIFTWKNIFSIFTIVASLIAITGFWIGNPKLSRILSYPISICMLIYDFNVRAISGIANELFTLTSSTIGILRHDKNKKR